MKAKDDQSLNDVPVDAFRVEYFGQGDLAKVAEDPLKQPELFQEFLDRHTSLRDLLETEESLVTNLQENAGRLGPLESAFGQLTAKRQSLQEIEKKLKIAEEGNLREVVGIQSKLASEKAIRESVETIATEYTTGFTFSNTQRDFDQIVTTAGICTEDEESKRTLAAIKEALTKSNAAVKQMEIELNVSLKSCARYLTSLARELRTSHQRMSAEVAIKLADLRSRGIATDMPGLELLLRQKTSVAKEIAAVEQRSGERRQCLDQRKKLRAQLAEVREKMTARRKEQLKGINANLGETIKDYTIFVK